MNHSALISFIVFVSTTCFASPSDLTFKSKIVSLRDAKTKSSTVRPGGRVRAQLKVFVIAKGIAKENNVEWLAKSLPKTVKGYIENTHSDDQNTRRYVNLKFQLNTKSIYCAPGENPRFEFCKAEYIRPGGNIVDLPAGKAGENTLRIEVLPTVSLAKLEYVKSAAQKYQVISSERQLSYIPFSNSGRKN